MKRLLTLSLSMLVIIGLYSFSALAGGGCTPIDNPDADYTDGTNKCSLGTVPFQLTSDCKVNDQPVATFSIPLQIRQVPSSWLTWSAPPFSESATPIVGFTNGPSAFTIDLGDNASGIAGFELEPNNFPPFLAQATFRDADGEELATVGREVEGNMGARLFAVDCGDLTINSIDVSIDPAAAGFAIAQLRGSAFPAATVFEESTESPTENGIPEGATSNAVD